jgi:hypothetical protein
MNNEQQEEEVGEVEVQGGMVVERAALLLPKVAFFLVTTSMIDS